MKWQKLTNILLHSILSILFSLKYFYSTFLFYRETFIYSYLMDSLFNYFNLVYN